MKIDDASSSREESRDHSFFDLRDQGPKNGERKLVPLKTILETRKSDAVVEVYVTAVPVKGASGALGLIRKLVPDDAGIDFQHLRRFAKFTEVPGLVMGTYSACQNLDSADEGPKLFLIAGPVSAVSLEELSDVLSTAVSSPVIFTAKVPLLAPTSVEQAKIWTAQYWPTVYKKSNPFGPHPSIVSRAEEEIRGEVQKWMDLAHKVARQTCEAVLGERVGVVIVDRKSGEGRVVAIAGDARWTGFAMDKKVGGGNVTAHATMRAIGMVAGVLKRRDEESLVSAGEDAKSLVDPVLLDSKGSAFEVLRNLDGAPVSRDDNATLSDDGPHSPIRSSYTMEAKTGREDLIPTGRELLNGDIDAVTTAGRNLTSSIAGPYHEGNSIVSVTAESTANSMLREEIHPKESASNKEPDGAPRLTSKSVDVQCQESFDIFQDHPLLEIEKEHFDPDSNQNGYLCHDLEIYCTHEPCVMCSMAIVHSRFGRVVFQNRMNKTGGMCADGELGHGLAWRKELNWTLLAWEWQRSDERNNCGELLHA